jgi:SNF2 family DNA or RNA helicase
MSELENNIVTHPENWRVTLHHHQLVSIHDMEKFEECQGMYLSDNVYLHTKLGILADITGYGKTLSVLGLISRDRMKWEKNVYEVKNCKGTQDVYIEKVSLRKPIDTTLIVVPLALVEHWRMEASKTNISVHVVETKKHCEDLEPEQHRLVLCSSANYTTMMAVHSRVAWKRIVFDEPHTMVGLSTKAELCSNFVWLVTATPSEIFKRLKRSMFSSIIPDSEEIFNDIIVKNRDEVVMSSFEMPGVVHRSYESFHPLSYILKGYVSGVIQEMIEAGNIRGALYALGYSRREERNVCDIIQERCQKKISLLSAQVELAETDTERAKLTMKVQEQSERIKDMINRSQECLGSDCCLCQDKMVEPIMMLCCQNILCTPCHIKWSAGATTCPYCRQAMSMKSLVIVDRPVATKHTIRTRPQIVMDIMSEKYETGRFILYSNHDESFSTLKELFSERGWTWNDMKGKKESKDRSLTSFREGETRVLLLNSQVNSSGFNLPETTDIIFYHKVSDSIELQVLGRALRMNRTLPLTVHHIL